MAITFVPTPPAPFGQRVRNCLAYELRNMLWALLREAAELHQVSTGDDSMLRTVARAVECGELPAIAGFCVDWLRDDIERIARAYDAANTVPGMGRVRVACIRLFGPGRPTAAAVGQVFEASEVAAHHTAGLQ